MIFLVKLGDVVCKMARRSGWLFLAVVLSCLILAAGKIAENGLPDREELDTKYLLTNQIVELNEQIEELTSAAKTHAASLKRKDKRIRGLEKELQQLKTAKSGADADVEAKLAAATKKNSDLSLQVSQLKNELERSKSEHSATLKRAGSLQSEANEKSKLVELVNEYKSQLKKAERALQIAQSGMLKAQREAAAEAREMAQSAHAWLPPWAATQAAQVHSLVTSRWATHGQPLLKLLQRGLSLKAAQAQKFTKPYIRSFNKKVLPVVHSQWKKVQTTVAPEYRKAKKLTVQYYQAAKKYLSPHLSKVHFSLPRLQFLTMAD